MDELTDIFCNITDTAEMSTFLSEVLTESERKDLELRWELIKRLKKGTPQRRIASDLKISLCKITRGAKILKNKKSMCNRILKDME